MNIDKILREFFVEIYKEALTKEKRGMHLTIAESKLILTKSQLLEAILSVEPPDRVSTDIMEYTSSEDDGYNQALNEYTQIIKKLFNA